MNSFEIIPFYELTLKARGKGKDIILKPKQKYKVTLNTLLSLPSTAYILIKNGKELYGKQLAAELISLKDESSEMADLFNLLFGKFGKKK